MILPISIAFWNPRHTIYTDIYQSQGRWGKRDKFWRRETRLCAHSPPALIDASSFRRYFGKKTKFFPYFLPDNN
ncbi:hypothetical protein [Microcoleus sp.]|uniref:hypothetical protein n=1 Tax=Microcoleus sp. TaxID=44472 RepID=UPI003593DD37